MKRVSKTAAAVLTALILGVSSLGVARVWAAQVGERAGVAERSDSRGIQLRDGQQDINTAGNVELGNLDLRDGVAVETVEGVRTLSQDGSTLLQTKAAVEQKGAVAAPRATQTRTAQAERSNGTAVATSSKSRSWLSSIAGIASFNKGTRFDGQADKVGFEGALVPATGAEQHAIAATSLKPAKQSPKFNVPLAIDTALTSGTIGAAYATAVTDHWAAVVAILGLGAFWVFFAGPANAWQIVTTLPSLASHAIGYGFSGLSHIASFAGNVATALNHVPAIAYAYEVALKLYSIGAAHVSSALSSIATVFGNLGTALMPNLHFVTSFPTVASYTSYAGWGYGIGALAALGWYRNEIMGTFTNVSSNWGYVIGGIAAGVHTAIAPFKLIGKIVNEVIRPVIRPIWDAVIVPVWNFVKDHVLPTLGKSVRAIATSHVAAIAQMTVTAGMMVLAGATYYLGSYKAAWKAAFKENRPSLAGLFLGLVSVAGITAFSAAAVWGLLNAPSWMVRDFIMAVTTALGAFGAVEGLILGYQYGPAEVVNQARSHGLSLIKRAEQLLGASWKFLTA